MAKIELYYWPTPNGHKIPIFLEEAELPYETKGINILRGEQFEPDYLKINPNNKVPTIVDPDGPGGAPISIFESGPILEYLGEKTGKFFPSEPRARWTVKQWLAFQISTLGPMFGQCGHFLGYAPEKIQYGIDRYFNETMRIYGILDRRLADREWIADEYSIADMATYPWIAQYKFHTVPIDEFTHVKRWFDQMGARPAVQRGMALMEDVMKIGDPDEETFKNFFGTDQVKQSRG